MISVRVEISEHNGVRELLLARQRELGVKRSRLMTDRRRETDPLSADAPDRAIQQENDEVVDSLDAAAEAELNEIASALQRLEEGSYGVCETCAGPIDMKRLVAVPCARECQSCVAQANS